MSGLSLASQRTRWPRLRSTARHPGFVVRTWRFGPLSGFRMRFDGNTADAIQQIHLARVSIARGGEGIFEGFTDGVRYKVLHVEYPIVVIAWWPSEATMRGDEIASLRRQLKATKRRAVETRTQRDDLARALHTISEHAHLDERERGFGEASRYYLIADKALEAGEHA